jgi:putative DNA primase/helicase
MRRGDRSAGDLDELKRALADNAEVLLPELFGEPVSKSKRERRWGSKGSLVVYLGGKSGPTFRSYETEQSGSLLDAIMFALDLSFRGAVSWARSWLGGDNVPRRVSLPKVQRSFDADHDEEKRVELARALWRAARSIKGTAGQRYLKARGVDCWPHESVRFIGANDVARFSGWPWWRWSSVIFASTDAAGNVRAIQMVALNDDGSPAPHWEDKRRKLKLSRGSMTGTAVRLPGDPGAPLMLCEGPETALSVWMALRERGNGGYETWANLGSIAKAPLDSVPINRLVVVCRDDDPRDAQSRQSLQKKIREWRREGRTVYAITPWSRSRGDKTDFNDLLKAGGAEAIRRRFDKALTPEIWEDGQPPVEAGRQLGEAIRGAFNKLDKPRVRGERAPFLVVKATLGLGKTEAALRACGGAIRKGHVVGYFVPNHKLTEELQRRAEAIFAEMGIEKRVRIWRGREQPDPGNRSRKMCVNGEVVKAAQHARLDVRDTVCEICPHKAGCAYLIQAEDIADLWLMPTSMLWLPRPANMKNVSLAAIDEGFARDGLVGVADPLRVTREELEAQPAHGCGRPTATADLRADLMPLRRKLLDALEAHSAGSMERSNLLAAGLTADEPQKAAKLEAERKMKVSTKPGMSPRDLLQEIGRAEENPAIGNAIMMWREVARLFDDQSGRPSGRAIVECEGGKFQSVRLYGAKRRGKGWDKVPTLHMDATADMTLIKARVPHAKLWADVRSAMPFAKVSQFVGRTFGKGELTKLGEEHEVGGKALKDAWLWGVNQAIRKGGRWLIITHKGAEEAIEKRFKVPDFIALAHFGAVAGRDEWRFGDGEMVRGDELRGVIVLGRPEPGPTIVEQQAAALTGRAVDPAGEWYPSEILTLRGEDGVSSTVDADRHPDPLTEALRQSICEAELLQAVGRGRGVRRDALRPLDIVILGNVPLPMNIDALAEWQGLAFDDAMMAEIGAVPSSAEDAADLAGMNRDAVKKSRSRLARTGKLGTLPYRYSSYSNVPSFGSVGYRRAGSRGPASEVFYDARRMPNPVGWLEGRLGPLEIKYHHDPMAKDGPVRCKLTGRLNFIFALGSVRGANLSDDERLAIVPEDCR